MRLAGALIAVHRVVKFVRVINVEINKIAIGPYNAARRCVLFSRLRARYASIIHIYVCIGTACGCMAKACLEFVSWVFGRGRSRLEAIVSAGMIWSCARMWNGWSMEFMSSEEFRSFFFEMRGIIRGQ